MLKFSFEFPTVLWAFDKHFFMLTFLDRRRSVKFLCFPLTKKKFYLNVSPIDIECYSVMYVCFTHYVMRKKLILSLRGKLLREAQTYFVSCSKWLTGLLQNLFVFFAWSA